MFYTYEKQYIGGAWRSSSTDNTIAVYDPATQVQIGSIASGSQADIDEAVLAARNASFSFSETSPAERLALLKKIGTVYEARLADLAASMTAEMGAPAWLAEQYQAPLGLAHIQSAIEALEAYDFVKKVREASVVAEPIGVCALITPWNWPQHQVMSKVAPAIAAGCAVIIKPSQLAPLDACILAEIMDEAGVPAGVFNLVNGKGSVLGNALAEHSGVDMVSFTGSQSGGVSVAQAAAPTVKRVVQEFGGKSPNIILDGADLEAAISGGVQTCFINSGQNCIAPSRMLVPAAHYAEAVKIACSVAEAITVGKPADEVYMGPLANEAQYSSVQRYIQAGLDEGARLVVGGLGKCEGLEQGYFAKPTIFADVTNDMVIAQEEIFGPVLVMIPYETVEDAIEIANDTPFGLAGYVSGPVAQAYAVGCKIKAGNIYLNGTSMDVNVPFGGFKQSGNGREFSSWGLEEFMEIKALISPPI
ncbi:MAG: aldehyde dehydrogenase family protein [Kordiimonadaceae bacterium]|nr:aldehyde dehydrogenase family protein [Kordiimonadaceae bacterium]